MSCRRHLRARPKPDCLGFFGGYGVSIGFGRIFIHLETFITETDSFEPEIPLNTPMFVGDAYE